MPAGEVFAFLGPNGAGKTTTIQMLTTLVKPTSGTMTLDGIDPQAKPLDARRRFGIVFQDPSLDAELTAYENLDLHGVLYHVPRRLRVERTTLGLDPQSRNQLWTHVKALNESERVTVFLTTHYMDEAERVAHRIGIIDHGRIVAQGTAAGLREQTGTDSLEAAFLALTGSTIRDERADASDQMRQVVKMWRR